jgi:hypothetical protein
MDDEKTEHPQLSSHGRLPNDVTFLAYAPDKKHVTKIEIAKVK